MFINYKAQGELIGAVEISNLDNIKEFVILVRHFKNNEYVVARYIDGHKEWFWGNYTHNKENAFKYFFARINSNIDGINLANTKIGDSYTWHDNLEQGLKEIK